MTPSAQRLKGYKQALREAGFTVDPGLIVQGDFHSRSGYESCLALVARSDPPTAIFAGNDLMAIGALKAAHDMGLNIPGELSIVGFDDIAWSSFSIPRLTTIAQPKQEMGRLLTSLLIERIKDDQLTKRRRTLPVKLIKRDSCGAV